MPSFMKRSNLRQSKVKSRIEFFNSKIRSQVREEKEPQIEEVENFDGED